jgi:hypothetical protein
MTNRFENARIIQGGACNPGPIVNALADAIRDCYDENIMPADDPAVFLILHQLTFVLTGQDFACSGPAIANRWTDATKAVDAKLDGEET